MMIEILQMPHLWLTTTAAFVLGSAIGSFLNVIVGRYPIMMKQAINEAVASETCLLVPPELDAFYTGELSGNYCGYERFNIAFPGSHCDACHRPLSWYENVPVLGWIILRGRCRTCGAIIPWRIPLVELICGIYGSIVIWFFGMTLFSLMLCLVFYISVVLVLLDLDGMQLPDPMVYLLLWSGLIFSALGISKIPLAQAVINAVLMYSIFWIIGRLMPQGLGGGDIKLFAAFSVYLGLQHCIYMIIAASAVGLLIFFCCFAVNQLSSGRCLVRYATLKTPMPFGPAICLSGLVFFWINCQ